MGIVIKRKDVYRPIESVSVDDHFLAKASALAPRQIAMRIGGSLAAYALLYEPSEIRDLGDALVELADQVEGRK